MIIFVIILGIVLRLISINQSLWLDEATTAMVAKMSLSDIFTKFLPGDFHPPLYYLIMKFWTSIFGYSEISLRIPSIIFGLGTVYLIYLIGKTLFNKRAGPIASILLATSGLSIYYSQEARMYALAAFLVALSVYLFLEKRWVLFSAVLVLIGMTDYVSLFIISVYFIAGWRYRKKIIVSLLPLAAVFLLWLPIFTKQISGGVSVKDSNWWNILGSPTFKNLALIPIKFIFGRVTTDDKIVYLAISALAIIIYGLLILRRPLKEAPLKVLWAWLVIPVVLGVGVSFFVPILSYFRFLFVLPAFYILVSVGISDLKRVWFKLAISFVLTVNIAASGAYLFNPKFQREDWRGLVKFAESRKTANSTTIFLNDSNMEAYRYYAPNAKIAGPAALKAGYDQVWLMRYVKDVFDPEDSTRTRIEDLGYKKVGKYDFNGVGVWEYIK